MKITVFNGSPRGQNSNTERMVKEFLIGAQEAGAETENIFLVSNTIKPCVGCFSCWIKTPGKCIIQDDMSELLDKVMDSDIVVFASPVYVGSVTGIMKNFIDRMLPMADPHFEKSDRGVYKHVSRYKKPFNMVLISNCGFPEQMHFDYFRTIFEYIEMNTEGKIIAEIYRGQGEILKVDNMFLKPLISKYNMLLRQAGKEVVENMSLSDDLKQHLEKPLVPYDEYIKFANQYWDEVLESI